MKTLKSFLLLCIVFSIVSCRTDEADQVENRRTAAGSLIFDRSADYLERCLEELNVLQNVNLYTHGSDAAERDRGLRLLKEYEVNASSDGVCTLKSISGREWIVATGNQPLNKVGTVWSVSYKYYDYWGVEKDAVTPAESLVITCISPQKWSLHVKAFDEVWLFGDVLLSVEMLTQRPPKQTINNDYAISGKGLLKNERNGTFLSIDFDITSPLIYKPLDPVLKNSPVEPPPPLLFVAGGIDMTVVSTNNPKPETINAELIDSNLRITFRGLTEVW